MIPTDESKMSIKQTWDTQLNSALFVIVSNCSQTNIHLTADWVNNSDQFIYIVPLLIHKTERKIDTQYMNEWISKTICWINTNHAQKVHALWSIYMKSWTDKAGLSD